MKSACAAACVGLALASSAARAEEVDLKPAQEKPAEQKPFFALSFGKLWVTPLIGPAYTPEMGLIVAGGILLSYRFDDESPRSSMPIALSFGSTGSQQLTAKPELYLLQDRLRAGMYFGVKGMNDNYFGVGYEKGNTTPLGVDTTQYRRDFLQFNGQVLWQLWDNLYGGGNFDVSQTEASQLNPVMAIDPLVVEQGTYFLNTGVGPIVRYDSRDTPENAFKGVFFQAQFLFYRPGLGGTTNYNILDLDYRQYKSLGRPGVTLAWNVRTRTGGGNEVPWTELSLLGSGSGLRGYREGRYRENTMIYGLLEFRWMDLKGIDVFGTPHFGLNGAVAWIGVGTMGASYKELNCILPNMGVGYRIAVQGRMAIRLDVGAGRESTGFYFAFNEAF